jgi:hypothetical protein
MSTFNLNRQFCPHAEAIGRWLFPNAERVGKMLVWEGVEICVEGLRAGQVRSGEKWEPLAALVMRMKNLEPEEMPGWVDWWLNREAESNLENSISEPEPEELREPEPEPERRIVPHARSGYTPPEPHVLLPQSAEAETGVLCSAMLVPATVMPYLIEKRGLRPHHFHLPQHRTIFDAMQFLHEERMLNDDGNDLIPLTQFLHDAKTLDQCGGAAYLTEIATFIGTAANVAQFADTVLEKHARREIIALTGRMEATARDELGDIGGCVEATQLALAGLTLGTPRSRLPPLCDLSTMLGANLPKPPPELVAGLLHQGSKLIIGGTSKGRKTFSLLDLAISVATGTRWWDMECQQGKVCYINFEIQEPFFAKRVEDICRAKGVELPGGQLMGWMLRGHSDGIELMIAELMAVLLREKFALIIFDPIYKALGGRDENKAGDVASLCNELERIAVKTGAAIAFGAHYSKGNQAAKESIDRIGGSGVFARDPDAILTMTAHEEEECFTVEATLRNFAPLPAFVVRWEWPLFTREDGADPAKLKKPNTGRETQYGDDDMTEPLADGAELTTTEWRDAVYEGCGMSERTFYAKKKPLVAGKKVRKSKLSGKWTLT